jgi:hypothetical protein
MGTQLSLPLSEHGSVEGLYERRRASWLLSPYSDDVWRVADTDNGRATTKIDFRYRMPDGQSLADFGRLHATVKEYAWWVRDPRYSSIDDAQTHRTMVRNLMHLAHALVVRGIRTFAHLEPYDIEQLVEDARFGVKGLVERHGNSPAPARNITVQALQRYLDPLESLHVMRRRLEADVIKFKPFAHGASRVAAVKGIGTERTPTPPPDLALHLMEQAAIWVTSDPERALSNTASREQVIRMMTACWIIIATFSARRDGEIDELRDDSLKGNLRTGWYLKFYIEKTLKRNEPIPVPPLVVSAINVLKKISSSARRLMGDGKLLARLDGAGIYRPYEAARHLDDFAKHVNVPQYKNRSGLPAVWHWSPHQFRRFFAVLYFYRYEGASIEVLNHHLRHFSLDMTRIYVTQDAEGRAMWTDVAWGYNAYLARAIAAGERSYAGAAGGRLKRAAQRIADVLRRNLRIATPERVGAALALMMQKQGMVLTPKPWVDCTSPATAAAASKAACRRASNAGPEALGPDFAFAGPTTCANCFHAAMGRHKQASTDAELTHLRVVAETRPRRSTLFGELEEARVVLLEDVRETRYARANPLERPASGQEEIR